MLNTSFVTIASFVSNTIEARLRICVPVVAELRGKIVYSTQPSPSGELALGGRKPSSGSVGGSPVAGSMLWKIQNASRVAALTPAVTSTNTPRSTVKSTRV